MLTLVIPGIPQFVFADQGNSIVRRCSPGGHVTVIGGRPEKAGRIDGAPRDARFYLPASVALCPLPADAPVRDKSMVGMPVFPSFNLSEFRSQHLETPEQRAQKQVVSQEQLLKGFNLIVTDEQNHCLRVITPSGNVETMAGDGKAYVLNAIMNG